MAMPAQQTMSIGFGDGCSARRASFYEHWAPGTFDMNATAGPPRGYTMVPHDSGWFVLPLQSQWRQPAVDAAALTFGPDGMSAPAALGFPFSYPGGQSSVVYVHEDGFLCLEQTPYYATLFPPAIRLLEGAPCLAVFWSTLDSCNCGTVRIHSDPVGAAWTAITWDGVRETGTSYLSTFQAVLYANGQIDVVFSSCHSNSHAALSGWSKGRSCLQPGTCDLSTLDTNMVITFPDRDTMMLETGDTARLGTTVEMETSRIPQSCKFLFTALGATGYDPGIDLTPLGATGCMQSSSYETGIMRLVRNGSALLTLHVPYDAALIGASAFLQSVAFDRSANPAGVLLSNGFELRVTQ
jgi:hypothetical protein